MGSVWLVVAACSDAPVPETRGPSGAPGTYEPQPDRFRWEGATFTASIVADVDGDGRDDAVVVHDDGWSLVRSPLARSVTLPYEADAWGDLASFRRAAAAS